MSSSRSAYTFFTAITLLIGVSTRAECGNISHNQLRSTPGKPTYKVTVSRQVILGENLLRKGSLADAAEVFRNQLKRHPKDADARAGLAMTYAKQFKLDRADEEFDKVLKVDAGNAMAHSGKAQVLLNRLQSSNTSITKNKTALLKQAGVECNLALEADPNCPEASYLLGQIYKEEGRLDKALEAFQGAIKLDSSYSDAYAGSGMAKLGNNDLSGAMTDFKQAISLNTGNSTAHYGLGRAYAQQGMLDNALAEMNTSLYQFPNSAPVRFELGKIYEMQGNTVAAIREFQESIRIKPENAAPYMHIADIRENRGDIEAAIGELRSGLEMLPTNSDLRLRIANDNLRLEKIDDAIKDYENVLTNNPRMTAAAEGLTRALYLKTQKQTTGAFIADNDFEAAESSLQRAIQMNPNNLQLRLAEAKLRALSGKEIDLSTIGEPHSDGERIAYAEALLAQNKFPEAAEQFSMLINNNPGSKELMQLGDLALMVRDLDSSEKAFRKASTIAGAEQRAKRGLDQVQKARQGTKENLNLASDLARKKQFASAIDKYHTAIFSDPRNAAAHVGLAESLERFYTNDAKQIREAITQFKVYMSLSPGLPQKDQEKLQKRIAHLESRATHLDQIASASGNRKGILDRFLH